MIKKILNSKTVDYILAAATAAVIVVFAALAKQSFIKTLPTLVTLVVQILMARANRIAFLIGGVNAVLYGIGYFSEGLIFSTIYAVAISFPMSIFSYFNWKKKSNNKKSEIRFMKNASRIFGAILILISWLLCAKLLGDIISDGSFVFADCFCFVAGIVATILAAFGFAEAPYVNIVSCSVNLLLWVLVCIENPQNINFVIISVYNLYKVIQTAYNWTLMIRENKMKGVIGSKAYENRM